MLYCCHITCLLTEEGWWRLSRGGKREDRSYVVFVFFQVWVIPASASPTLECGFDLGLKSSEVYLSLDKCCQVSLGYSAVATLLGFLIILSLFFRMCPV